MSRVKRTLIRLVVVVALLAVVLGVRVVTSRWNVSLPGLGQEFITLSLSIIIEALPFVLLGIILSLAVQVWLPAEWLLKRLPQRPWVRRVVISLSGVGLPVCECGNVPLARGLLIKGLTPAEALVFLLAAPILNPLTIWTTCQAFGGEPVIVAGRVLGGFLIAQLVGWVYARAQPDQLVQPGFLRQCRHHASMEAGGRVRRLLALVPAELRSMLPALVLGALVAGAVQVAVPREVLLSLGSNPAWSVLAMVSLAFVVSICSSVDAFFALAFGNTFTAGSLVSFLTFGPMIDIKMLSLLQTTFRRIVLIQVTAMVTVLAVLGGLVVNYAF